MQRVNSEITGGFGKPSITARPSQNDAIPCDFDWPDSRSSVEESVREDRRFDIRNSSRASVSVPSISLKADQPRYRGTKNR